MNVHSADLTQTDTKLCDDIARRGDSLLADLTQYVAIPTGWNHTPGLDEIRGLVTGRLAALGATVELTPGEPTAPDWLWRSGRADKPNTNLAPIAVCKRCAGDGPKTLIASHLDTVFDLAGDFQTLELSSDGGTGVGPGVVDMKGGLVIAIAALEALACAGVEASWTYLFNSDEEMGSYHSAAALRALAPDHVVGLCTEPALPGGELAIERGGSGQFLIETVGKSAHVGRAFTEGVSAVTALAEALVKIAAMPDPAGGRIVNVGPIEGGGATNIVPDGARAWGNVRYAAPSIGEDLENMLDALATEESALPGVRVRRSFNRPAKPLTPEVERLAGLAQSCATSLGQELPLARTGGVCDGNILQEAGLPTIDTLGVRGGGLHTHAEWIDISSLVERCQLFALLLSRIAAGALAG